MLPFDRLIDFLMADGYISHRLRCENYVVAARRYSRNA